MAVEVVAHMVLAQILATDAAADDRAAPRLAPAPHHRHAAGRHQLAQDLQLAPQVSDRVVGHPQALLQALKRWFGVRHCRFLSR